jgi:hypothetical protein
MSDMFFVKEARVIVLLSLSYILRKRGDSSIQNKPLFDGEYKIGKH